MRFKDYINRISNSSKIYTKPEIREMKLKDFFAKKPELLAQYDVIGLPKLEELKNSPNVNYVEDPNEVFGGRWEGVGVNEGGSVAQPRTFGVADAGLNKNGSVAQPQGAGGNTGMKGFDGTTGGAAPVLEGGVRMDVNQNPVASSPEMQTFNEDTQKSRKPSLQEKYSGLTSLEALGKAASKLPMPWTSSQYYGHAAHLADGEEPSLYMKRNNDFYKYGELEDENLKESF